MVLFIQETYGVNYSRNNVNQIEKNPGLLFLHLFSQIPIYTRRLGTN